MIEDSEIPTIDHIATSIDQDAVREKRFALLALAIFILSEGVSTLKFILTRGLPYNQIAYLSALQALIFWWILPILIVYKVEHKDWRSLGLAVQREKRLIYLLYAVIGLILPALFLGIDRTLLIEFGEQVIYIGFIEEIFYRGYLLRRMCDWLGDTSGLLITSILFGLGHIFSRLAQKGFAVLGPASLIGLQSFLGGLLLGSIYLRARNIWPSTIFHVSLNMYLNRIIELFS